jgi:hypothetical protein
VAPCSPCGSIGYIDAEAPIDGRADTPDAEAPIDGSADTSDVAVADVELMGSVPVTADAGSNTE